MAGRVAPYIDNTGLVFAYDQANIVRSYLGEPTTNLATNTPSLGGWPGSYTVIDSDTKTFDFTTSTVEWGGDASWTTFYYNVSAYTGQYVTISATFEYASDPNKFNFLWIGQTSGSETYLGYSSEADRNQKSTDDREDISWSGVIGSGGKVGILIWMSNGNSTTVTARISNIQVEVKSHKTPFTTGTRSVTQGLKDLTGRSTIDLTNVSFDANAQMTFDGTNDVISLSPVPEINERDYSLETVVYRASTGVTHGIWSDLQYGFFGVFIDTDNKVHFRHMTNPTYVSTELISNTSINVGTYHIVNTYSLTGGFKTYVNGVLDVSTSATTIYNLTGRGLNKLGVYESGAPSNANSLNGKIHLAKVYYRTLPASEIQQNFNAIKGRYGL